MYCSFLCCGDPHNSTKKARQFCQYSLVLMQQLKALLDARVGLHDPRVLQPFNLGTFGKNFHLKNKKGSSEKIFFVRCVYESQMIRAYLRLSLKNRRNIEYRRERVKSYSELQTVLFL